jgi:hypothetical protein
VKSKAMEKMKRMSRAGISRSGTPVPNWTNFGRGQGGENITGERERRTARLFLLGLASVGDGLGFALPGEH